MRADISVLPLLVSYPRVLDQMATHSDTLLGSAESLSSSLERIELGMYCIQSMVASLLGGGNGVPAISPGSMGEVKDMHFMCDRHSRHESGTLARPSPSASKPRRIRARATRERLWRATQSTTTLGDGMTQVASFPDTTQTHHDDTQVFSKSQVESIIRDVSQQVALRCSRETCDRYDALVDDLQRKLRVSQNEVSELKAESLLAPAPSSNTAASSPDSENPHLRPGNCGLLRKLWPEKFAVSGSSRGISIKGRNFKKEQEKR